MPITLDNVTLESGLTFGANYTPPPAGFGNNLLFPGTTQFLYTRPSTTDLIAWRAETGYTLEYWFYYNSLAGSINGGPGCQDGFGSNYWSFGPLSNGSVEFYYWSPGTTFVTTSPGLVTANAWNNIAVVCTSSGGVTTINIYVNGILQQTTTTSSGIYDAGLGFGMGEYTGNFIDGYMNNLRVSNIARYSGSIYALATSSFTPDANTLLLIQPTEASGSTISYQDSGAGGVMTNQFNNIIATTTRANHT
jgi:hypothetical protein